MTSYAAYSSPTRQSRTHEQRPAVPSPFRAKRGPAIAGKAFQVDNAQICNDDEQTRRAFQGKHRQAASMQAMPFRRSSRAGLDGMQSASPFRPTAHPGHRTALTSRIYPSQVPRGEDPFRYRTLSGFLSYHLLGRRSRVRILVLQLLLVTGIVYAGFTLSRNGFRGKNILQTRPKVTAIHLEELYSGAARLDDAAPAPQVRQDPPNEVASSLVADDTEAEQVVIFDLNDDDGGVIDAVQASIAPERGQTNLQKDSLPLRAAIGGVKGTHELDAISGDHPTQKGAAGGVAAAGGDSIFEQNLLLAKKKDQPR